MHTITITMTPENAARITSNPAAKNKQFRSWLIPDSDTMVDTVVGIVARQWADFKDDAVHLKVVGEIIPWLTLDDIIVDVVTAISELETDQDQEQTLTIAPVLKPSPPLFV